MKKLISSLVLLFILTVAFTGCGGSGGDAATGSTAGTFLKTVHLSGGAAADTNWIFNTTATGRVMMLYRAGDINGSGTISSISFHYNTDLASAVNCPNMTVRMGHTNVTSLDTTYDNNVEQGQGSFQTLVNDVSFTVPAGSAGGFFRIPLTQTFNYNGVDNLVVEVSRSSACSGDVSLLISQASPTYTGSVTYNGSPSAGSPSNYVPDIRFNFTGGDNSIRYTDCGSGCINSYPFAFSSKIQLLYTAAEINGSGIITGFAFPVGSSPRGNPTVDSSALVTIKLGHTSLTGLTDTFANNFNSGTPVTVANTRTVTIPAGVPDGNYVWIPLPDGAFNYNGTDNLIVEIESSAITGSTQWIEQNGGINTRLDALGGIGATTGTLGNAQYFVKFRFAGGNMDVFTAGGTPISFPFSDNTNNPTQQFLYRAAELGTKGNIYGLSFRLTTDSTATDYGSFRVIVGATTNTALNGSATFSGNMTGAQTLYNGTYSITAGLKAGDWVYIPFSTSFVYDGVSNLVVQTANPGAGSANNSIRAATDATRYLNRRAYNNDNTSDTIANTDNLMGDIRLWLVTGGASGR